MTASDQPSESTQCFKVIDKAPCAIHDEPRLKAWLSKWGMLGGLRQMTCTYTGTYHRMAADAFASDFFNNSSVQAKFQVMTPAGWAALEGGVSELKCTVVPCTETRLDLFDKLREAPEPILRDGSWDLMKCFHDEVDGFPVQDMLREMVLHEESPNADVLTPAERKEFIWLLMCHLALGGAMNQFEDNFAEYRMAVKILYKHLLSVRKNAAGTLEVASMVYRIEKLVTVTGQSLFPNSSRNNFCYLIVNPNRRVCRALYHAFNALW